MTKSNFIIDWAARNHNIMFMITMGLVLIGAYGLVDMNKDEFPQFTIRQGVVVGVFPGASAEEVEEQLTRPLEQYLFTFQEVDKKKTYSYSEDGMVYLFVELNKNVHEKDVAWSKIRHGLKDFKAQLPGGVLAIVVMDDFGNTVSMLVGLSSYDKTHRELQKMAETLSGRLYTVPAMGNVKILGTQKEEIAVYIQPERLASYGISPSSILAELYLQGFSTVTGNLETEDLSFPLHVITPFSSEKEISEVIVYSDPRGNVLRLNDIAKIERVYPEADSYISIDDKNTLLLSLEMQPGNNIVAFGNEVNQILEEFEQEIPSSVDMQLITNQPKVVNDSVVSFLKDLLISILVVIGVMMLLFPLKSALVAGSGIPICTMIAIAIMYATGLELNTVTLAALIAVLGMICDNSIVIIDGYTTYLNQGYSRMYSALVSAKEFFPPLVLATVAICGMFYPVMFVMTGPMADFVKLFPWAITYSLAVSLAYAVLVVPYLEFRFIKKRDKNDSLYLVERVQEKFFAVIQKGYEKLLVQCFKHPAITLLIGIGMMIAGVVMFLALPVQMMPKAERSCFAIEISLPKGSSLANTKSVCDSLQRILNKDDRIESMTIFVGQSSPRFHATYAPNMPGKNMAQFIVNTVSNKATNEVLKQYTDSLAEFFPSAHVRFKQLDYQAVTNSIEIYVKGDNLEDLNSVADKLMAYMRTLDDEVAWVHTNTEGYLPGIKIELLADEATRLGITKTTLSLNLASALGGQPLGTLWEGDYSIPIRLRTSVKADSLSCEDIGNMLIPSALPGVWVPVRQVARITPDWHPARIAHRNGERCITVACDLKYGKSQPASMKKIDEFIDTHIRPDLPVGVEISHGGLTGANEELIPELALGVVLAALVIFMFLVFNFGKISISILSLSSTLLCFFGAFAGLALFKLDFGMTSVLGVVSLMGIIVRNGIIMFEYAEELRQHHNYTTRDAAFYAGLRRMRPIFLTSATTALGVVPMIIAATSLWMPMGIVICFGTVVALLFIVTILPVAYWKIYETKKERQQQGA